MCGYFREKLHVNHFKVKALGLTMMGSHEITLLIGRTLCFALHQQWSWGNNWRSHFVVSHRQQVMVQSNHFSSELAQMPSDQHDDALPCGAFDLTAEARYLQDVCIMYFTSKNLGPVIFCRMSLNTSEAYLAIRCLHSGYFSFASLQG